MSGKGLVSKPAKMNERLNVMEPMPVGPYYMARQHEEANFDNVTVNIAKCIVKLNRANELNPVGGEILHLIFINEIPSYTWGTVIFYVENGRLRRCLEHFDCT